MTTITAQEQAWNEGYEAGGYDEHAANRSEQRAAQVNPYTRLLADRREFIREALDAGYGAMLDDNDEPLIDDDLLDDLLDAHDEWLAQQLPCSATLIDRADNAAMPCVRPGGHTGGHETETGRTWPQS